MLPDKPDGATRFLFQNVRGLKKTKNEDTLEDLVRLQQLHGIDLLGMSEHHQDTMMITRKLRLSDTVHRIAPGQAACQFDSSQEASLSGNQCGGTGITMIGSLVPKLEANGRGGDSMGRWSYVHLRRKAAPPRSQSSLYTKSALVLLKKSATRPGINKHALLPSKGGTLNVPGTLSSKI